MTRMTIDLPDSLHKTLKSLALIDGQTMRNIAIEALEKYAGFRLNKDIGKKGFSEKEAEELLKPTLMQYSKEIKEGSFSGKSWEDIKKENNNS